MRKNSKKRNVLALWVALCLLISGIGFIPMEVDAENSQTSTSETVIYVNGVDGNDDAAGISAETALKTMGAAYAKIPTDNTKTTIVISGTVDVSNSGLVKYNEAGYESSHSDYANTYIFPAHSGEVVITSKWGEEDYTSTASLSFGSENNKYYYVLEGSTTFANINISNYAGYIFANFYNLTLGEGITGTEEYYPAAGVHLGFWRKYGNYNITNDCAFIMNSGKVSAVYAGTRSWNETFSKMSVTINDGTIKTLNGSGYGNKTQSKAAQVTINGGTIETYYGVGYQSTVGSGGVNLTIKKGANVTNVYAERSAGTLSGPATLNLVGYDEATALPGRISGFTNLGLTNSSVTIGENLASVEKVSMTDNSSLTLGAIPAGNIGVTVQKSGETWITDTALVTAPVGAESKITLAAAEEDDFTGYEFKSESSAESVTWAIDGGDSGSGEGDDSGDGSGDSIPDSVIYVDGVNGNDANEGTGAETALKTMGAAFAKVPTDNTKTTIVISGNVDVSNSGLVKYNDAGYEASHADYNNTYIFPKHSGEVVITSKWGEEDYTDAASLSFGSGNDKYYILEGSITFADIKISNYAGYIFANFYNLTLGEGITGTEEYYPAAGVHLGFWRKYGNYNTSSDSAFIMNSGNMSAFYAGTRSWNETFSKISVTINGGTIKNLHGTGYGNYSEQSKAQITINGGNIGTCYGVALNANVGSGGVNITIKKGANVTNVSAIRGSGSTLNGPATLNLVGYDEETVLPGTISGFTNLELTNSSVTIGNTTMWGTVKRVSMTDDSSLKLNVTPTTPIEVVAKKSGSTWNTERAIITAPTGTENVFTIVSPVDYEFAYASGEAATWTLKKGELKIGDLTNGSGEALNIDLKLPNGVTYTELGANASAYDFYQARLADLTASGVGKEVAVVEPVEIKAQVEIYVDPVNGDDRNRGSKEAPYKTIQKALTSVEMLQSSEEPYAGIAVYLRGGIYSTSETIALGKGHSGRNNIPVIISAYEDEEVIISGGTSIAGSDFTAAKDLSETAYEKLPEAVRDRIVAVDLTQHGISKDDFAITSDGPNYQVFVDGEELTLSRYPNVTKLALTGKVLHIGYVSAGYSDWPAGTNKNDPDIRFEMTDLRPTLWENDGHIWLNGSMYAEWDIRNIRVKEANASTGVMRLDGGSALGAYSKSSNKYYYYNILEELDVPGEFYVDKATGIMYIYPIGDMNNATVTFSVMKEHLISLNETENVVFNGLTIENGGNYGIHMTDCEQVVVQNCTLRNLQYGIYIHGKKNGIIYSEIYKIANRPVHLQGSTPFMDYVPEQNFVQSCYIHNTGTVNVRECEVYFTGTGNVVSHNLLQGMYGVAIYFAGGKDCIIEYNEITGAPSGVQDFGAIYSPYGPSTTGNHYRYNYIHDIGLFSNGTNPQAIYLDEGTSGNFVYGNICSNVPRGFFTNSGSNNVVIHNIIQDGREGSTYSIYSSDNFKDYTINERFARSDSLANTYNTYIAMSSEQQAELKKRDPLQAKVYENIKAALDAGSDGVGLFATHDNYAHDNLIYDHGTVYFSGTVYDIADNVTAATNPFVNVTEHNFTLVDDTIITWEDQIPSMDRIGVITNNKQAVSNFNMYAPSNGNQKVDPFEVILKWTCAGGADSYMLEISKNEDMSEAKTYNITNRYYFFDHDDFFTYGQTYYWRVTAYTVAESRPATPVKANNGQIYSFKTMTLEEYLESNPLNTEELTATIALADSLAEQVKDIRDGGLYYDGTSELLKEAILAAKEVMGALAAQDQVSVNVANATLQDIINKVNASRVIQYVTFEEFDADEWIDASSKVTTTVDGDELQMLVPGNDRGETVYEVGMGVRDILCFRYKIDTKTAWNGFAIAQSNLNAFITQGTQGYFICINPGQIELQKYTPGKAVQINKIIDDTIFNGGEYYDVEIGSINNPDGSVSIHFKINDNVIFDMTEYVDTENDEILPSNPIVGYGTFGVVVNPSNGITHIKKTDLTDKAKADYSALDEEVAKEPEDADAYTADSWAAYQEVLESAKGMVRTLTAMDQSVVDEYAEALKEAREALVMDSVEVDVKVDIIGVEASDVTIKEPEGGWVEGTNTFTVSSIDACVVAMKNTDGTYTRVEASETETDGTYSFTINDMKAGTELAIAVNGDTNGDGLVNAVDAVQVRAASLGKITMSDIYSLTGDANGDGVINAVDAVMIRATSLEKLALNW